jgi:hypothetical protein
MDKVEVKELTKVLGNLVSVIKDQNKYIDKQNQCIEKNTEALKELRTRLASINNGGTILNSSHS